MPTKKEILKRKDQWIKALQATIDKYQYCINNNVLYNTDSEECALCLLDDDIRGKTTFYGACDNCIHLSSFGTETNCYFQKSFNVIQGDHGSFDENDAYTARIAFLQTILDKLK